MHYAKLTKSTKIYRFVSATLYFFIFGRESKKWGSNAKPGIVLIHTFQLFLCGLCWDATPTVYYVLLVPQHNAIKDKHCFVPPTKPSKAASRRPGGLKHMPCNHNDLGSSLVRGCCCMSTPSPRSVFLFMFLIKGNEKWIKNKVRNAECNYGRLI